MWPNCLHLRIKTNTHYRTRDGERTSFSPPVGEYSMALTRRLPPWPDKEEQQATKWKRRRDIPLAILAWIGVAAVVLWSAWHIVRALLLLVIAAMLAYALSPIVKLLEKYMKRPIAIILTGLVALSIFCLLFYFIVDAATTQFMSLAHEISKLLDTKHGTQHSQLENVLGRYGITASQIATAREQITSRLEGLASSAIPLISSLLDTLLDMVVVIVITIYLLIDGLRINQWCRKNLPESFKANFLLDTLQRVVGGYIRGQFLLALLIGVLVGAGMAIFRVPYALLLGMLAFILEFIPVLGTLISGAVCILIALATRGPIIAAIVLVYFTIVHILEGDIIGPRIVGKAIGLHPVVSLAALIAGSELFGIWGALLASPVAGVVQVFLISLWEEWKRTHPDHFVQNQEENIADEQQLNPLQAQKLQES
jgi:predicted PurR-regulated permease PerM